MYKKLISVIIAILFLNLIMPIISNAKESDVPLIKPSSIEDKNEVLENCLLEEVLNNSNSDNITTMDLPGDFTNLCKIVKSENTSSKNYDNTDYAIKLFVGGSAAGLLAYMTKGKLGALMSSGLGAVYAGFVSKNSTVYMTVQQRLCNDSTGANRYAIIKYYSDKKRSKHIYTEYKKIGV
ncbi:hypothetical protein [Kurthia massiliensis]|uniref:hypothetical protein n=1 Tax=Kurthia massiliensis TaxID=1033739 RepID=UPI0002883019|nr:hypothetical protein [Kurthia massiliensis]